MKNGIYSATALRRDPARKNKWGQTILYKVWIFKNTRKKYKIFRGWCAGWRFSEAVIKEVNPSLAALVDPFQSIDYNASEYGGARWEIVRRNEHYNFVRSRFKEVACVRMYRQYFETFVITNRQKFNFIYLDACNDYLSVKNYLERSADIIEDGGIIGINDYSIYENNTEATTKERTEVVKAVNEFIRNTDWYVHAFALNDSLTSDLYIKKIS